MSFAAVNLVVLGSLTAPVVTGLPLAVASLVPEQQRASTLAMVVVCGAIASVVANPLFGYLSDRTTSRFGRRRPWVLGGVVVGAAASVLVVAAESLWMLTLAWVLAQTAYNAALAAIAAMLGDQVPERERASASGLFAGAAFLGTVPPLLLAAVLPSRVDVVVLAMPTVAVVVVSVFCLLVADPPRRVRPSFAVRLPRRWPVRSAPGFAAVWTQRFVMQLGFSLMTSFTLFYVADRFAVTPSAAGQVVAVTTMAGGAAVVAAAVGAGFLAAKSGRYGGFLVTAAVGLFAAAVTRAFSPDLSLLWISAVVGGLALGTFFAVDFALALRTIPAAATGGYLGVLNVAETLPQTVAPVVALLVLGVGDGDPLSSAGDNYVALYLVAGIVALSALAPLRLLRPVLDRRTQSIVGD